MIAPAAIAFGEAVSARYQRARTPQIRPVDAMLRALSAPVQIDHHVFVDARSWRTITAAAVQAVTTAHRSQAIAGSVVMHIAERRRDAAPEVESSPRMAWVEPFAERPRERGDADARSVRSVPMVLARQAAPAESRTVKHSVDASEGWPPASPPRRHAAHLAEPAAPLPQIDVNHLTERVVAAIDRRMVAARERMGL